MTISGDNSCAAVSTRCTFKACSNYSLQRCMCSRGHPTPTQSCVQNQLGVVLFHCESMFKNLYNILLKKCYRRKENLPCSIQLMLQRAIHFQKPVKESASYRNQSGACVPESIPLLETSSISIYLSAAMYLSPAASWMGTKQTLKFLQRFSFLENSFSFLRVFPSVDAKHN